MRYENFVNGEFYHVYNRGVDRRDIFRSESDADRFLEGIRVFNTEADTNENISFKRRCSRNYLVSDQTVKIHSFAFLPNHFHLLIQQHKEFGISRFMHRLITSHTHFINKEEGRTGHLLESRFKAKRIDSEAYLHTLVRYIHLNPLSMIGVDWKHNKIENKSQALSFLKTYRWSSFHNFYHGIESPHLDAKLLNELFSTKIDFTNFLLDHEPSDRDSYNDFL